MFVELSACEVSVGSVQTHMHQHSAAIDVATSSDMILQVQSDCIQSAKTALLTLLALLTA